MKSPHPHTPSLTHTSLSPVTQHVHQVCLKCNKPILQSQSSISCSQCEGQVHLKSTNVTRKKSELPEFSYICSKCSECRLCLHTVAKNHKAIQCDSCSSWIHTKCNLINDSEYEKFKNDPSLEFQCLHCYGEIFPFTTLNQTNFNATISKGLNLDPEISLNFTSEQEKMVRKIMNNISSFSFDLNENKADPCAYLSTEEFKNLNLDCNDHLSIMHLNVHSIECHVEEINLLLDTISFNFDFLCFSESKVISGIDPITDISIKGYQTPVGMPTKSSKGGVLLYVKEGINFIQRNDLAIESDKYLESVFIEVFDEQNRKIIIGCVYRHPCMNEHEFLNDYLSTLSNKLAKENKPVYLCGDWNFNLINYASHEGTLKFIDTMMTALLAPVITVPTRLNNNGGTLIDNIFTNNIQEDRICGNLIVNISDHLPSYLLVPKPFKTKSKCADKYVRDKKNFDKDNFKYEFSLINWETILELEKRCCLILIKLHEQDNSSFG